MTKLYLIPYKGIVIGKRAIGDPQPPRVPLTWVEVSENTYHATTLGAPILGPTITPAWRNSRESPRTIEERLLRLEAHLGLL